MSLKNKTKQIIAVVALAAFVLFTVFGTVGLVITSHHNYERIHCRTCERIALIKNAVNMINAACIVLCFTVALHARAYLFTAKMPLKILYATTVSLKIKLNN